MTTRFKAFTLAEVLITLGIIGIVAAITIPNLVLNYQKKSVANRLKKMYAVSQQAVKLSEVENGEVSGWDFEVAQNDVYSFSKKYFAPYFKGAHLYSGDEFRKLTKDKYSMKSISGKRYHYPWSKTYAIIVLADGSYFITKEKHFTGYEWLFIDINGFSGPNRMGRDIFVLSMGHYYNYKKHSDLILWGDGGSRESLTSPGPKEDIVNSSYYGCSKDNKYGEYAGYDCGALIKLDGWKISDDYPW